jgi:hypothetical protein
LQACPRASPVIAWLPTTASRRGPQASCEGWQPSRQQATASRLLASGIKKVAHVGGQGVTSSAKSVTSSAQERHVERQKRHAEGQERHGASPRVTSMGDVPPTSSARAGDFAQTPRSGGVEAARKREFDRQELTQHERHDWRKWLVDLRRD